MGGLGKSRFVSLLGIALAMTAVPALAQERCTAEPVASLPMLPMNGHVLVPVQVNDQPFFFLVDTGGFATSVSANLVERLKLPTYWIRPRIIIEDAGGAQARQYARADSLVIGNLQDKGERYMVGQEFGPAEDGLIAPDYLRNFDLDFDFAAQRLNLYRPRACSGKPPGSGDFSAVDMDVTEQGHIRIPVTLDGKRLQAMLDTGAPGSIIAASEANANFAVQASDEQKRTITGGQGGKVEVGIHDFGKLEIGKFTQTGPRILVAADDKTRFDQSAILLGLRQLSGLRLFVSYRDRKLYVSRPGS
jgi:predicted aspartyl protease